MFEILPYLLTHYSLYSVHDIVNYLGDENSDTTLNISKHHLLSNSTTITDLKMIVQTSEKCILVPLGNVLLHVTLPIALNIFVFDRPKAW